MMNNDIFPLIRNKIGIMFFAGLLIAALSFLFLVLTQKNYKASTDYLLVQNQNNNQDFYTLSKSAEYLGKILSEAVYSEKFINEVVNTGKMDAAFLPIDKKDRLEEWAKTVKVRRNLDLGIITIVAYSNSLDETQRMAEAVSNVLTEKNYLFHGAGEGLEVRILSGPIIEKNPSIREIVMLMIAGFFIGAFLVFILSYYKESQLKESVMIISGSQPKNDKEVSRVVYDDLWDNYHPQLDELARQQEQKK